MTWPERSYRAGRVAAVASLVSLVVFSGASDPVADIVGAITVASIFFAGSLALYVVDDGRRRRQILAVAETSEALHRCAHGYVGGCPYDAKGNR